MIKTGVVHHAAALWMGPLWFYVGLMITRDDFQSSGVYPLCLDCLLDSLLNFRNVKQIRTVSCKCVSPFWKIKTKACISFLTGNDAHRSYFYVKKDCLWKYSLSLKKSWQTCSLVMIPELLDSRCNATFSVEVPPSWIFLFLSQLEVKTHSRTVSYPQPVATMYIYWIQMKFGFSHHWGILQTRFCLTDIETTRCS